MRPTGLKLAVAGDPVAHSLSPAMQTAALELAGISGTYGLAPCDADGFRSLIDSLRRGELDGLNVTMPHKSLAYELCDRATHEASRARSVNTVGREEEEVVGHSTDVVAFADIFGRPEATDLPIVVYGSGGSARAAIAAAPDTVHVVARNARSLATLRAELGDSIESSGRPVDGFLLVNCTPVGMKGESLSPDLLDAAMALVDLPYASGDTPAASVARQRGLWVVDGLEFLALQAAASFSWWTGVDVPIGTMVAAARNA